MERKNSRRLVAVGICCPNCGRMIQKESLIKKTKPKKADSADMPTFEWEETHMCLSCETKFIVKNSNQ
jgi:predicted RNA-binding Zn-ribbon protein involved in translation (DUF1610 family)